MSPLPNGAYNYYPPLSASPIVAQVDRDIVWFAGDDQYRMLANCSGRFVKLQECPLGEDNIAATVKTYADWIERARQIDPGDEMPPLMLLALLGQPSATPIAQEEPNQ